MSLLQFDFESQYLCCKTTISVILPDRPKNVDAKDFYSNGQKYKVLWLLHGTFGDHTDWLRKSMIEIYAREKNLICVMPSGMNADYESWPGFGLGYDMKSHLIKELMPMIYNWFPASSRKEDNFIAGLSMGGRGVLNYILDYPELFAAGAVLSAPPVPMEKTDWDGTCDKPLMRTINNPRFVNQVANAGGKENYIKNYDIYKKIFDMHEQGTLPKLIMGCGQNDFLYPDFCYFREQCEKKGVPITFGDMPGVAHEWRFWDPFIQKALEFFDLDTDPEKKKLL